MIGNPRMGWSTINPAHAPVACPSGMPQWHAPVACPSAAGMPQWHASMLLACPSGMPQCCWHAAVLLTCCSVAGMPQCCWHVAVACRSGAGIPQWHAAVLLACPSGMPQCYWHAAVLLACRLACHSAGGSADLSGIDHAVHHHAVCRWVIEHYRAVFFKLHLSPSNRAMPTGSHAGLEPCRAEAMPSQDHAEPRPCRAEAMPSRGHADRCTRAVHDSTVGYGKSQSGIWLKGNHGPIEVYDWAMGV